MCRGNTTKSLLLPQHTEHTVQICFASILITCFQNKVTQLWALGYFVQPAALNSGQKNTSGHLFVLGHKNRQLQQSEKAKL